MNQQPTSDKNIEGNIPIYTSPFMTTAQIQQQYRQQKKIQSYIANQEHEKKEQELEASKTENEFSLIYNVDGDNPVNSLSAFGTVETGSANLLKIKEKLNNKIKTPTFVESSLPTPGNSKENSKSKQRRSHRLSTHGHHLSSHGHRISHRLSKRFIDENKGTSENGIKIPPRLSSHINPDNVRKKNYNY